MRRSVALAAVLVCAVALLASPALANAPRATATVVEATDNEHTGVTIKVLTVTNLSMVAITRIAGNGGTEHVLPAASCTGGEGFVCQLTVAPGASQTICVASGRGAEYVELTYADGTKESLESKVAGPTSRNARSAASRARPGRRPSASCPSSRARSSRRPRAR